jgi:DNA polymerase (family 10)
VPKLKAALQKGVIAELPGFGEKSARKLLDAIENFTTSDRIPREKVMPSVRKLLKILKSMPQVLDVETAGSLRRGKVTVHDIDILVSSKNPKQFAHKLSEASFWKRMIGKGETKVSGIIDGFQCDIRVVAPKSFGAALVYFTGSKGFNIYLRKIAIAKKLKLNEYGLFDVRGKMIAGKTEEEVFKKLDVEYLTPEQRERF